MKRPPDEPRAIYSGAAGALSRAFDGALGIFAPRLVHAMQKARMKSAVLLAYEGARTTRTQPHVGRASADAAALPDLQALRDRSRALVRDDPHTASAVAVLEENVIGTGLVPKAKLDPIRCGMTPAACQEWGDACEREWRDWFEEADSTGEGTFYDLQRLVLRGLVSDGEQIAKLVTDQDGSVKCELIDVDRLQSPGFFDTDQFRGGVELDAAGRAIAYHILPKHPDDILPSRGSFKPVRILRDDGNYSVVQHVFRRNRAGQTRGVPAVAAALTYMRGLHDYMDSELTAARANSKLALFIKRPASTADPDIFPVSAVEGAAGMDRGYLEVLEEGTIEYLNEGEEISPYMPNRPTTSFDPFVVRSLRAICASFGLAYELVAKDLGQMNYSSSRSLFMECRRGFDVVRTLITRKFCRPWWANMIFAAVARGDLVPPPQFLDDPEPFLACRWVHPAYGWVDPVKEVQASRDAVAANLSTPYDEAARSGLDAEQVLADRARFGKLAMELERQNGLPAGYLTGFGVPAATTGTAATGAASSSNSGDAQPSGAPVQQQQQEQPA